jgi:hypothetical protein
LSPCSRAQNWALVVWRQLSSANKKATRASGWPKSREYALQEGRLCWARLVPRLACNAGVLSDPSGRNCQKNVKPARLLSTVPVGRQRRGFFPRGKGRGLASRHRGEDRVPGAWIVRSADEKASWRLLLLMTQAV